MENLKMKCLSDSSFLIPAHGAVESNGAVWAEYMCLQWQCWYLKRDFWK